MWDWRYPISDIKKEIRDAKSRGESSTSLDSLSFLLDTLSDMYQRLEKEYNTDTAKENPQLTHWEKYITHLFDKASHYNTVIIAAAYIAFFTVWSNSDNHSIETYHALSGILILISLTVYVLWEVGQNIYMSRLIRDEAVLFKKGGKEYLESKEEQEKKVRQTKINIVSLWYSVLLITITTGLTGAGTLLIGIFLGPTISHFYH